MKTFLTIGLKMGPIEEARSLAGDVDALLLAANNYDEAVAALAAHKVDAIIMGAGLDLDERLRIIGHACQGNHSLRVHMKDRATGPGTFPRFVSDLVHFYAA